MPIAISPRHTIEFVKDGFDIEKKIDVFLARVEGWQLGIARQLIDLKIEHRGFALLHILLSYFEMIAKYRYGHTKRSPKRYFKEGVELVFPQLGENGIEHSERIKDLLYANVRSGVYHSSLVGRHINLTGEINYPLGYNTQYRILDINPDLLTKEIELNFNNYKASLQNEMQGEIRRNFEKRFDYEMTRGV